MLQDTPGINRAAAEPTADEVRIKPTLGDRIDAQAHQIAELNAEIVSLWGMLAGLLPPDMTQFDHVQKDTGERSPNYINQLVENTDRLYNMTVAVRQIIRDIQL